MDIKKIIEDANRIVLFILFIMVLVWYIKGHFGKKWYWFWLFTAYVILANVFKHEIRGY